MKRGTALVTFPSTLDVGGQRHSPAALPPGKSLGAQSGRVWKRVKSLASNGAQTLGRLETKRTAIPTTLFPVPIVI